MRLIDADVLLQELGDPHPMDYNANAEIAIIKRQPSMMSWISVKERLPGSEATVLAVKELKSGRREICLAYCMRDYQIQYMDSLTGGLKQKTENAHWVTNGSSNILYWMPLPEIPEG